MAVPTITITGQVLTPDGATLSSGTIVAELSQSGSVMDGAVSQRVVGRCVGTITAGSISGEFDLVPNDAIMPPGTYYKVTILGVTEDLLPFRSSPPEKWQLASSPATIDVGAVPRLGVIPGVALGLLPASATVRGAVRLAGDLGGTADSPTVVGTHLAAPLPEAQGGTGATVNARIARGSASVEADALGDVEITPSGVRSANVNGSFKAYGSSSFYQTTQMAEPIRIYNHVDVTPTGDGGSQILGMNSTGTDESWRLWHKGFIVVDEHGQNLVNLFRNLTDAYVSITRDSSTKDIIFSLIGGEPSFRFVLRADGQIRLGPGTSTQDVTWGRTGTNEIGTDQYLYANKGVRTAAGYGISVGSTTHKTADVINAVGRSGRLVVQDVDTDATNKIARIGAGHYTNTEEPVFAAVVSNTASANTVQFGGGSGLGNAATGIEFYTAANNTTVTGTRRLRINTSGNVAVGTTESYGSGVGVVFLENATTPPSTNPSGGGVLYVEGGALKYRGSSGTVTTLGPA